MFEDTEKFVEELVNQATTRVETKKADADNVKGVWDKFFSKYPDLKGREDIVEIVRIKNFERLKNTQPDYWFNELGTEARKVINEIRGASTSSKELSSEPAIVSGGSNGKGTPVAPQQSEATDFITQMKRFQTRKRG